MTPTQSSNGDPQERLFEELAVLLETRERTGELDTATIPLHEPEVAAGVQEYLAAAEVVSRFASGLVPQSPGLSARPMPERIGDYELLAEIGRGGAAVVYRARQIGLNRLVAIKMLQGGRPGSLHDVDRLRFEAEAVAQLQHPGIVPIYDVGEHEGRPYFSMPLFEEGSLSGRISEYMDRPRRAAELVKRIALAVQHAHERGILHRDLKPSNILLDDAGRAHVADFGLAKRLAGDHELTRPGELIGTPAYMAPERVAGSAWAGPATIATDVYGLGAILYVLLTGRPPFEQETPVQTLLAVGTTDVVRPTAANSAVDRDLEAICLRCLEKVPGDRYSTAADVSEDLRCWLEGKPIAARQLRTSERIKRWCRRHPLRATAVVAAALLFAVGTIGLTAGYLIVSDAYREAETHRATTAAQATRLNQQLYVSQISAAHQHLQNGRLSELRKVLDGFRNQPDIQGFEWHWLDRQSRRMPEEVVRFTGHTHILYGGDFSPDGGTVATCGADGTIRLWEADTGAELRKLENGAGLSPLGVPFDENCVDFSPDGRWLASVGEDGGVRLWSLPDGVLRRLTPTTAGESVTIVFSGDSTRLAAAWGDGRIRVWRVPEGELLSEFNSLQTWASSLCFVPTTGDLIAVDYWGAVGIYDPTTGELRRRFDTVSESRAIAVDPTGKFAAVAGNDGKVRILDVHGGTLLFEFLSDIGNRSLAFSPEGMRLAAIGNNGCVRVWSVAQRRQLLNFQAHPTTGWHVEFSPDVSRLLTVGSDHSARIWDLATIESGLDDVYALGLVGRVLCSPDGRFIVTVDSSSDVWVHNVSNIGVRSLLPARASYDTRFVFLNEGRQLAYVTKEGALRCWDLERGEYLPDDLTAPASVPTGVYGPTIAQLAVQMHDRLIAMLEGDLFARDGDRWKRLDTPHKEESQRMLGTLADGQTLVVRCEGPPRCELWRVEEDVVSVQQQFPGSMGTVAASRDGRLAFGHGDGIVQLIDLHSNSSQMLLGHHEVISAMDFSPDGRTLVSVSKDGSARLWNVQTGADLCAIVDEDTPLRSAAFFPDGRTLAIAGDESENGDSLWIFRTE